jgi:hypothetical protein
LTPITSYWILLVSNVKQDLSLQKCVFHGARARVGGRIKNAVDMRLPSKQKTQAEIIKVGDLQRQDLGGKVTRTTQSPVRGAPQFGTYDTPDWERADG